MAATAAAKSRVRAAADTWDQTMLNLHAAGLEPACHQRSEWTSEESADRAEAAMMCLPCPVLRACGAYADAIKPTWGVWSGADRSR